MIRPTRANYWSSSKLSLKLRERFGLTNPLALTWEGWDDHEEICKQKAPIIHWITDTGFNKLQDVVLFPSDLWWSIKTATVWKFLRNLWLFRKALWGYRSWDYHGMFQFMETCARDMSRCHKEHGHLMRSEETAKELKVFAELLHRINEDTYTDDKIELKKTSERGLFGGYGFEQKPDTLPAYKSKSFYKIIASNKKNDLELIGKMLARKSLSWWN